LESEVSNLSELKIYDLIFDPGHGGADPGAVGPTTKEKNNVLALAKKIAVILEATGRFRVKFTRTTDKDFCTPAPFNVDLDLKNRVKAANSLGGDAFYSFHNNSAAAKAYGNEVYALAAGGEGEKIAKAIRARMALLGMTDRGVKYANWYVLKWTEMPAVLIEYGFINSEEATILAKMDQAALAIAQGIGDYFGVSVTDVGKELDDVLKTAVLLYTKEDFWAGYDVAAKHGNCAIFVRPADLSVPAEAMAAEKLIVVGGATTNHPNEVLLSGNDKYATAAAVAKYLG